MATLATLLVRLVADSSGFVRGIGQADSALGAMSARMTKTGAALSSTGKMMTHRVTLPIVAAGAAAVHFSTDFETSMKLIQTQAGGTAKDVAKLRTGILNMEDSQSAPIELANALFHLKSVGMDNKKAMEALQIAEEGASVGQAELETTTNALAGAYVTGIKGARTFEGAMGTLNAMIGAGNLRMEDLTSALSTGVLPAAKTFGLSMADVGAALGTMTSQGQPANAAATRLRMSFALMAAPTDAAAKSLKKIGMGATDMAKDFRSGGIVKALADLKEHLSGLSKVKQAQVLTKAFGGGRSSAAIMGLVNNLDMVSSKFSQIRQNAGKFGEAVKAQAKTSQATFSRAMASLQKMAIKIGDIIRPVATEMIQKITGLMEAFTHLDPRIQKIIIVVAAFAAAAGPVLFIVGQLVTLVGLIISPIGLVVVAIAALTAAFVHAYQTSETFRNTVKSVWESVQGVISSAVELIKVIIARLVTFWKKFGADITNIARKAWDYVATIVRGAMKIIQGIIQVVTGIIKGDWSKVWEGVKNILSGAWDWIKATLAKWPALIISILKALGGMLWELFKAAWRRAFDAIAQIWITIDKFVRAIPGKIIDGLKALPGLMYEAGKNAITSFFNGLKGIFGGSSADFISDVKAMANQANAAAQGAAQADAVGSNAGSAPTVAPPRSRSVSEPLPAAGMYGGTATGTLTGQPREMHVHFAGLSPDEFVKQSTRELDWYERTHSW